MDFFEEFDAEFVFLIRYPFSCLGCCNIDKEKFSHQTAEKLLHID